MKIIQGFTHTALYDGEGRDTAANKLTSFFISNLADRRASCAVS
jgi:hypothetical protein